MSDTPAPARWVPAVGAIVGIAGLMLALLGGMLTFGGWRGRVDLKIEELDRRLSVAEANQRTYIPILIAMNKDVAFLADRARRDDERADARHRR